jgi:hypothetical protein
MRGDDIVEITAAVRQDRDKSLAIWMGDLDDDGGQVWIFLPKAKITYTLRGSRATIKLSYWLAVREKLLPRDADRHARTEARLARIEEHLGLNDPTKH